MRTTINEASIVIQLINEFDKRPILNANITCNGRHIPFIKKDTGHYVFINMHNGNYLFDIDAFGFEKKTVTVDLTSSSVSPQLHIVRLNYLMNHPRIPGMKKIVFTVKNKDKLISNRDIKLRLDTKVSQLRVIDPMVKGSKEVVLNSDFNSRFLFQEYSYEKKPNLNILFTGFDYEKKAYLNDEPFKSKVAEGGLLNPVWNFVTDDNGVFVLPIDNTFLQKNVLDFTVFAGKKSSNIVVEIKDNTTNVDVSINI